MRPLYAGCVNCMFDGPECSHPDAGRPGFFDGGTTECWTDRATDPPESGTRPDCPADAPTRAAARDSGHDLREEAGG